MFRLHDESRRKERVSGVFMFLVNMILRLDRREAGLLGAVAADSLGKPDVGTESAPTHPGSERGRLCLFMIGTTPRSDEHEPKARKNAHDYHGKIRIL